MNIYWDQVAFKVLPLLFAFALLLLGYFLKSDKPEGAMLAGLAAWCIAGFFVTALIHEKTFSETETSGLLRPANDPTPPTSCPEIPKGAVVLLLGNSTAYTKKFPSVALRVAGEDLVTIGKRNGGVAVSAKIYSADARIVAEIKDNEFHINPANYFRRERPDRHTLVVYDQTAKPVLYVRYLNQFAIKILGTFHGPRTIKVLIEEDKMVLPRGNIISRFCVGNVGGAAINVN